MTAPLSLHASALAPQPIRAGQLEVRLAQTQEEIEASQALRYQVFVDEIGAIPSPENAAQRRDIDQYDAVCDHLLVLDHTEVASGRIVGSYRLLRRENMRRVGQFYTASEFDISTMESYPGEILELGRSCVHPDFRSRAVMQLLWRGIAAYLEKHKIDVMFGCGSLYGADPKQHREALSYLYHYHLAPQELRILALPELYVEMNLLPKESLNAARTFAALPPLIKGYLRLGGFVGKGAVVDKIYNTTDVAIVVKTQTVTGKYVDRYASEALKESIQGA